MKFYIKEAREQAGYSQKQLAEIIGVAPNTFVRFLILIVLPIREKSKLQNAKKETSPFGR